MCWCRCPRETRGQQQRPRHHRICSSITDVRHAGGAAVRGQRALLHALPHVRGPAHRLHGPPQVRYNTATSCTRITYMSHVCMCMRNPKKTTHPVNTFMTTTTTQLRHPEHLQGPGTRGLPRGGTAPPHLGRLHRAPHAGPGGDQRVRGGGLDLHYRFSM